MPLILTSERMISRFKEGKKVQEGCKMIYDEQTGLEWLAGPDEDTTCIEAKAWVDSLGDGWRMPVLNELAGIFSLHCGKRNIRIPLKTTGWFVWATQNHENKHNLAWLFLFNSGGAILDVDSPPVNNRAFAVRSK